MSDRSFIAVIDHTWAKILDYLLSVVGTSLIYDNDFHRNGLLKGTLDAPLQHPCSISSSDNNGPGNHLHSVHSFNFQVGDKFSCSVNRAKIKPRSPRPARSIVGGHTAIVQVA